MRIAMVVGADRADDHRQRALAAGDARPLATRTAEKAVSGPILSARHRVTDENDFAAHRGVGRRHQISKRVETDDFALNARRGG